MGITIFHRNAKRPPAAPVYLSVFQKTVVTPWYEKTYSKRDRIDWEAYILERDGKCPMYRVNVYPKGWPTRD